MIHDDINNIKINTFSWLINIKPFNYINNLFNSTEQNIIQNDLQPEAELPIVPPLTVSNPNREKPLEPVTQDLITNRYKHITKKQRELNKAERKIAIQHARDEKYSVHSLTI